MKRATENCPDGTSVGGKLLEQMINVLQMIKLSRHKELWLTASVEEYGMKINTKKDKL